MKTNPVFNFSQVMCFDTPLHPEELLGVKRVVADKQSEAVADRGLSFVGFRLLHELFIERGRVETTW